MKVVKKYISTQTVRELATLDNFERFEVATIEGGVYNAAKAIIMEEFCLDHADVKSLSNFAEMVGSLMNEFKTFKYKVGDGITGSGYSDSTAYTVIAVSKSGTTITIQEDTATLVPEFKPEFVSGGFAGHCTNQQKQRYTYERNTAGAIRKVSRRKLADGRIRWIGVGENKKTGTAYRPGRFKFHDYNF